jgi:acetylornithine aminotransferase
MKLFDVYPINNITITKAKDSYVWDENGVQYLDMYGGHAVVTIGHTHPHWVRRIEDQLNKIAFYSNSVQIPIQKELADKLATISGKADYQLFLVNSGAEANENAMKLASFHTGRKKIVAFKKAFHGRTSLAVAATDNKAIVAPVNETDNIDFLPFNDAETIKNYFETHGNEVAAIIIEAIQGVGGIQVATESFLQLIRELCNQHGALFIADEVQCGYGRSGRFFATDHAGINAINPKHGMLGTTFGGNHLACAAALAVLEVIEQENLLQQAAENGAYLLNRLQQIEGIENIRGTGLIIGFDVPDALKDLRNNLLQQYHIFTGEAKPNVIRLLPALNIRKEQLNNFVSALQQAIEQLQPRKESLQSAE